MAHIFSSRFSLAINNILIDKGGQCPILMQQDGESLSIWLGKQRVKITWANGASVICRTAKVYSWALDDKQMPTFHFEVKDCNKTTWFSVFWKIKPGICSAACGPLVTFILFLKYHRLQWASFICTCMPWI